MKFIQSPVFAAILGGVLFLLTSAFLTTQGVASASHNDDSADEEQQANVKGPSWEFFNPELDQLVVEIGRAHV